MKSKEHIDDVLSALMKSASNRTKNSLLIINEVCQGQVKIGSTDFRLSTIGALSKDAGGPSNGTIRNKRERYIAH